jgi:hypothetical protein
VGGGASVDAQLGRELSDCGQARAVLELAGAHEEHDLLDELPVRRHGGVAVEREQTRPHGLSERRHLASHPVSKMANDDVSKQ